MDFQSLPGLGLFNVNDSILDHIRCVDEHLVVCQCHCHHCMLVIDCRDSTLLMSFHVHDQDVGWIHQVEKHSVDR